MTMYQISDQRLEVLFSRFPLLALTLNTLNEAGIPFAVGGSGCLYLLGNERLPDDVDIYLPDEKHDYADQLFHTQSYTYESATENVRNSNPEGDHSIQLTSRLRLNIQGMEYDLRLTEDVLSHRFSAEYKETTISLLPPEDVLLIKALLQRGKDVGKHDIEDIHRFLEVYPSINREYLRQRIASLNAEARIGGIFDL
ncbi:nucleotidyltransferase [Candidatus Uhrbacteria bacterium]|nr:nucleotidyltransferase [Candidatus Uhrbacteria bacterium]